MARTMTAACNFATALARTGKRFQEMKLLVDTLDSMYEKKNISYSPTNFGL
jgi:hypothetical protein